MNKVKSGIETINVNIVLESPKMDLIGTQFITTPGKQYINNKFKVKLGKININISFSQINSYF